MPVINTSSAVDVERPSVNTNCSQPHQPPSRSAALPPARWAGVGAARRSRPTHAILLDERAKALEPDPARVMGTKVSRGATKTPGGTCADISDVDTVGPHGGEQ